MTANPPPTLATAPDWLARNRNSGALETAKPLPVVGPVMEPPGLAAKVVR